MSEETRSVEPHALRRVSRARIAWFASIAFCAVLPALVIVALFAATIEDGSVAIDFRQFYRGADAIVRGDDPYPSEGSSLIASARPYVYPPFPALLTVPLTALPLRAAEVLVMLSLVVVALCVPFVLGVRDWRCFGLVLLWPPVISAIQTSNVTLWFALALAIVWRYRDRTPLAPAALGVTLATKFLLWPLVVWLAATRRLASAALACAIGATLLVVSWAVIGFAGFRAYPGLLRRLEDTVGKDSYTVNIVAVDLGATSAVAGGIWLALGLVLLAAVVVIGRRGDERRAFVLAIAAALALSPLVWLHYFALLVVMVALTRPTLGVAWFVPLAMFVGTGSGNPSLLETLVVLGAAAATVGLSLRRSGDEQGLVGPECVPFEAHRAA